MKEDINVKNIIVYISEECKVCDDVVFQLKKWDVPFETKNVTTNRDAMAEMQSRGLFGTPVTIHRHLKKHVLGYNEAELTRLVKSEKVYACKNAESFLLNHNNIEQT